MKAIIVGSNGIISMREVLQRMDDESISIFHKITKRRSGEEIWKREFLQNGSLRKQLVQKPSFGGDDIIIKWGNSIPLTTGNCTYYNQGLGIKNASDKLEARFLMEEEGVPTPVTYGKISDIDNYPVIVRPKKHRAGKYFYVAKNEDHLINIIRTQDSLNEGFYMSKIFDKDREFRLHCAFGKVLVIKEKPAPQDKSEIAWNFAINEEAWTTIERKNYDLNMCRIALESMDSIGLDIGAVDIMTKGNEHVVCEINTSPSLTDYLADKYAMLFSKLFNSTSKVEKWNYKKFEKGSSLSWKNCQLMDRS